MKLVVDTNVIISALIQQGITRKIIFESEYNLITPSFSLTEIKNMKNIFVRSQN